MARRKRPTVLSLGEVSSATLRPEDLIPSFIWDLNRIRLPKAERSTVRDIARASDVPDDDPYWQDNASEDLAELFTIMEAHCPDYCYFGSLDGDGACFGVWPSHDSIRDDIESGEIASYGDDRNARYQDRESALAAYPSASYVAHVSDHGNLTLYRRSGRTWREVFSII